MPSRQSTSKSHSDTARPITAGPLTTADRQTARQLSNLLIRHGGAGMRFTVSSESGDSVDLSPSLVDVLETAAKIVANGTDVAVMTRDQTLTSQQAADLLNVSRQYMVRLLERGDIASSKVGTHRRVRAGDLATYRARRDQGRRAALDALADQAQASGGYDAPAIPGPRRRR